MKTGVSGMMSVIMGDIEKDQLKALAKKIYYVTLGHVSLALLSSLLLYFVSADILTPLVVRLEPYWPLLHRVKPYMLAQGPETRYVHMSVIYVKDLILFIVVLALDVFWMVTARLPSRPLGDLKSVFLKFFLAVIFIIAPLLLLVFGPSSIHSGRNLNSVFAGGGFFGLCFYSWAAPSGLGVYFFFLVGARLLPSARRA